ncbi:MAG: hypothetical protein ACRDHW_22915, partial [Ktedonobacteraceae bacterium]
PQRGAVAKHTTAIANSMRSSENLTIPGCSSYYWHIQFLAFVQFKLNFMDLTDILPKLPISPANY